MLDVVVIYIYLCVVTQNPYVYALKPHVYWSRMFFVIPLTSLTSPFYSEVYQVYLQRTYSIHADFPVPAYLDFFWINWWTLSILLPWVTVKHPFLDHGLSFPSGPLSFHDPLHAHPRARWNPTISSSQLIFETSCFMLKLRCGVASLYQVCGVPFHFALHHCFRLTKNR